MTSKRDFFIGWRNIGSFRLRLYFLYVLRNAFYALHRILLFSIDYIFIYECICRSKYSKQNKIYVFQLIVYFSIVKTKIIFYVGGIV